MSSSRPTQVLWFTGLSGSGKTTLTAGLHARLTGLGIPSRVLDGDQIRRQSPVPLGFSKEERIRHIENVALEAARLEAGGFVVLVALISPYREARARARALCRNFREIFLAAPLEACIARDPKGLYKRALAGEIPHFTGISDVYEAPEKPDLILDTSVLSVDDCENRILQSLL